jgi:hypothetical protein
MLTHGAGPIQHPELVAYLRLAGWKPAGQKRGVVAQFVHEGNERSDNKPIAVQVVTDPDLGDYGRRNDEIVRLLADFEGVSIGQMIEAIASPSSDVLSFSIHSDTVAAGSIPLEDSIRLRQAQKAALLAAAHSALDARGHFPRMARSEAIELVSTVTEGQTARGSYISRLFVPVRRPIGQLDVTDPPPYARAVTSTLFRALDCISNAVRTGVPEDLLTMAEQGVSANLLSALAEMRPRGAAGALAVSVRWTGGWLVPRGVASRVRLAAGEFETFPGLAKQMRDREQSVQYTLAGYIVSLERVEAERGGPGEITVLAPREDVPGKNMRVRLTLQGEEYDKAVEAHKEANRIRVIGTLKKEGRRWSLDSPSPIVVATGGDDDDS